MLYVGGPGLEDYEATIGNVRLASLTHGHGDQVSTPCPPTAPCRTGRLGTPNCWKDTGWYILGAVASPLGFAPRLRPSASPLGFAPRLRPSASPLGFAPRLRPSASPLGFAPRLRPSASPLGFAPRLRPSASPLGFAPRLRPSASPLGFAPRLRPLAHSVNSSLLRWLGRPGGPSRSQWPPGPPVVRCWVDWVLLRVGDSRLARSPGPHRR